MADRAALGRPLVSRQRGPSDVRCCYNGASVWEGRPVAPGADDAKILEVSGGDSEVLQSVIARQLIGRDITG